MTDETQLDALLGEHVLTGCDTCRRIPCEYGEVANVVDFVLDGRVISAIEDPSDGYRSCMSSLAVGQCEVKNTFPACVVIGERRSDGDYEKNDVVDLRDTTTGKVVLRIGTANNDDYYPWFVGEFDPTAMAINAT